MDLRVIQFGSWKEAQALLRTGMADVRKSVAKAMRLEAELMQKRLQEGIKSQGPGMTQFKPLSPLTLAIRRFTGGKGGRSELALYHRGELFKNIKVTPVGLSGSVDYSVFVGVLESATNAAGKSLFKIAKTNEYGGPPTIIKITPKMMAFLHAAFSKGRAFKKSSKKLFGSNTSGVIKFQIPPRPLFQPVWEQWGKTSAKRILATAYVLAQKPSLLPTP